MDSLILHMMLFLLLAGLGQILKNDSRSDAYELLINSEIMPWWMRFWYLIRRYCCIEDLINGYYLNAVMLMGTLVYGIRYTFPEYVCTLLVAGGVSMFALLKVRDVFYLLS